MKKNLFTKIAAGALSAALSVTMLAGCGNKKSAATKDNNINRRMARKRGKSIG